MDRVHFQRILVQFSVSMSLEYESELTILPFANQVWSSMIYGMT
jgi:hypothetical protein